MTKEEIEEGILLGSIQELECSINEYEVILSAKKYRLHKQLDKLEKLRRSKEESAR